MACLQPAWLKRLVKNWRDISLHVFQKKINATKTLLKVRQRPAQKQDLPFPFNYSRAHSFSLSLSFLARLALLVRGKASVIFRTALASGVVAEGTAGPSRGSISGVGSSSPAGHGTEESVDHRGMVRLCSHPVGSTHQYCIGNRHCSAGGISSWDWWSCSHIGGDVHSPHKCIAFYWIKQKMHEFDINGPQLSVMG